MHEATIDKLITGGEQRMALWRRAPAAFFVSSMLAGAYVGIGIVLILVLGASVPPEWSKLVMAASFGIALVLVVLAGADLFTGHHLYGTLGWFAGRSPLAPILLFWAVCWVGNLLGSLLLALLVTAGGGGGLQADPQGLLQQIAAAKMNAPLSELLARAVLCNWLVCLAVWMSARVDSDAARCIVIWWCLFGFIACGLEHSVANMTLLSLALLGAHGAQISVGGLVYNLLWVSLGNIVGGALFVAGAYWLVARHALAPAANAASPPALATKPDDA